MAKNIELALTRNCVKTVIIFSFELQKITNSYYEYASNHLMRSREKHMLAIRRILETVLILKLEPLCA